MCFGITTKKQVSLLIVVEPMNDEMSQMTFASDIDSDQSGHHTSLSLHCKHDEKLFLAFNKGIMQTGLSLQ